MSLSNIHHAGFARHERRGEINTILYARVFIKRKPPCVVVCAFRNARLRNNCFDFSPNTIEFRP